MSMRLAIGSVFAVAVAGLAFTSSASADVATGMLNCKSGGSSTFVVLSTRTFDCTYTPTAGGPVQVYKADVQRFGAQIGFTNDVVLGWAVFSVTGKPEPGALAGKYVGGSAGAAVGIGGSANGLVGGLGNSFTLQPVSLQGETGLNVVATVTGVDLTPAAPMRHHRRHK